MLLKSVFVVACLVKVISSQYLPCSRQVTEIIEPLSANSNPEFLSNAIQSVILSKLKKTASKTPLFGSISQPIIDDLANRLCPVCASKTVSSTPVVLTSSIPSCQSCNSVPCACNSASVSPYSNSIVISSPISCQAPSPCACSKCVSSPYISPISPPCSNCGSTTLVPKQSPCSNCGAATVVPIQSSCSNCGSIVNTLPSSCNCNSCTSSLTSLINNLNSQCGCSSCLNKLSEVLTVANGFGSVQNQGYPTNCPNNKYAELLSIVQSFRNPTCNAVNSIYV